MQYSVPQFIEIEDRVIGSLTVKQFLYLVAGGIFLLLAWQLADIELFVLLAIVTGAVVVPFAFIKVNGRPFQAYFSSFLKFFTRPKRIYWVKTKNIQHISLMDSRKRDFQIAEGQTQKIGDKKFSRSKIRDLVHVLDTGQGT